VPAEFVERRAQLRQVHPDAPSPRRAGQVRGGRRVRGLHGLCLRLRCSVGFPRTQGFVGYLRRPGFIGSYNFTMRNEFLSDKRSRFVASTWSTRTGPRLLSGPGMRRGLPTRQLPGCLGMIRFGPWSPSGRQRSRRTWSWTGTRSSRRCSRPSTSPGPGGPGDDAQGWVEIAKMLGYYAPSGSRWTCRFPPSAASLSSRRCRTRNCSGCGAASLRGELTVQPCQQYRRSSCIAASHALATVAFAGSGGRHPPTRS